MGDGGPHRRKPTPRLRSVGDAPVAPVAPAAPTSTLPTRDFAETRPDLLRQWSLPLITPISDLRTPTRTPFPVRKDLGASNDVNNLLGQLAEAYDLEAVLINRGMEPVRPLPRDFKNLDAEALKFIIGRESRQKSDPGSRKFHIPLFWPEGGAFIYDVLDRTPTQREMLFRDMRTGVGDPLQVLAAPAARLLGNIPAFASAEDVKRLANELEQQGISSEEAGRLAFAATDFPSQELPLLPRIQRVIPDPFASFVPTQIGVKGAIEEATNLFNLFALVPSARLVPAVGRVVSRVIGSFVVESVRVGGGAPSRIGTRAVLRTRGLDPKFPVPAEIEAARTQAISRPLKPTPVKPPPHREVVEQVKMPGSRDVARDRNAFADKAQDRSVRPSTTPGITDNPRFFIPRVVRDMEDSFLTGQRMALNEADEQALKKFLQTDGLGYAKDPNIGAIVESADFPGHQFVIGAYVNPLFPGQRSYITWNPRFGGSWSSQIGLDVGKTVRSVPVDGEWDEISRIWEGLYGREIQEASLRIQRPPSLARGQVSEAATAREAPVNTTIVGDPLPPEVIPAATRRTAAQFPGTGTTPAPASVAQFGFSDDVMAVGDMWRTPPVKEVRPMGRARTASRILQEKWTDKVVIANQVTEEARKWWQKNIGRKLPDDWNAEIHFAVLPSRPAIGVSRAMEARHLVRETLGDLPDELVDNFLFLRHQLDVVKMYPGRSVPGLGTPEKLQAAWADFQAKLGPEVLAQVEEAASHVRNLYDEYLGMMVESGLVDRELATLLRETYPWYNRTQYVENLLAKTTEGRALKVSVNNNGLRRLGEVGREDPIGSPIQVMFAAAANMEGLIALNNAAKSFIRASMFSKDWQGRIIRSERAVQKNLPGMSEMSYMHNGGRVSFQVDEAIARMIRASSDMNIGGWEKAFRWANAPLRGSFVTYNPAFLGVQFTFDMMTVSFTQGVLPHRTFVALWKNLRALARNDPEWRRMIQSGSDPVGYWGRDPRTIVTKTNEAGNIALRDPQSFREWLTPNVFTMMREIGHATEMAPRRAVFEARLRDGLSEATAGMIARRSTVDFTRMGTAMKLVNAAFLFSNAALQGSLLLPRALTSPYTRKLAAAGVGGYLALQLTAYAWNRRFPEYKDVSLFDKFGQLMVMLPSDEFNKAGNKVPHYYSIVPTIREFAALSAPLLFLIGKLDEQAPESVEQFLKAFVDQINPFSSVIGNGLPVPTQIASTLVQGLMINHDFFRERPIIPEEFQGLPKEEQFDEETSLVARRVGPYIGLSPFQLDYFLRQGVFFEFIVAADAGLRQFQDGIDPEIDGLVAQLEDIQVTANPEDISLLRRTLLTSLDSATRKKVLETERQPKPKIPFVQAIIDRFYRRHGGNLYRAGQAAAERKTGLSAEQTRTASARIASGLEILQGQQEQQDALLLSGDIGYGKWRELHRLFGTLYTGLILGISQGLPKAAQVAQDPEAWNQYRETLYTVGGTIDDRRSRGRVLAAGYNGIPLVELFPGTGVMDFESWFPKREEFRAGLSEADLRSMDAELNASMTTIEKLQRDDYDIILESGYWTAGEDLLSQHPEPTLLKDYREYRFIGSTQGVEAAEAFALTHPLLNEFLKPTSVALAELGVPTIDQFKHSKRVGNKTLDVLLRLWEFTQSYDNPVNIQLEGEGARVQDLARLYRQEAAR
jgi:hypothetical protein